SFCFLSCLLPVRFRIWDFCQRFRRHAVSGADGFAFGFRLFVAISLAEPSHDLGHPFPFLFRFRTMTPKFFGLTTFALCPSLPVPPVADRGHGRLASLPQRRR